MRQKTRKCGHCGVRFKVNGRGRPRLYCCRSHRTRAYEKRRLRRLRERALPFKLLVSDMKEMFQKEAEVERVVLRVLRKILPSVVPPPSKPALRLVTDEKPAPIGSTEDEQA